LVWELTGFEDLARAQYKLGKTVLAISTLGTAIPVIETAWGSDDPWRMELMLLQESWLRQCDMTEAADGLKMEIATLIADVNKVEGLIVSDTPVTVDGNVDAFVVEKLGD
jgi:hypothetical protein